MTDIIDIDQHDHEPFDCCTRRLDPTFSDLRTRCEKVEAP